VQNRILGCAELHALHAGVEPRFEHRGAVQPRTIMCVKILYDKDVHSTKINVCVAMQKNRKNKKNKREI